jgi:hypothetical protein
MLRLLDSIFQCLYLELPSFYKGVDVELSIAEGLVRRLRTEGARIPELWSLVSIMVIIGIAIATWDRSLAFIRGLGIGHAGRMCDFGGS